MLNEPPGWLLAGRDLRKVARIQRQLIWLILIAIACQLAFRSRYLPNWAPFVAAIIHLLAQFVALIQVIRLLGAVRAHLGVRILYIILLFAPCINILILLSANSRATRALRQAGLRVGFMGVPDEDVVRHLAANHCRTCGYNLTGNITGRCPECGQQFDQLDGSSP